MPHIPDHELEQLKQTISLQRLAESQGIILKKHGKDYLGLCPFHDDKEPSLVISPDKNLWHCLGACQSGGDVINWVMKSQGLSFRRAVTMLQGDNLASLSSLAASHIVKRNTTTTLNPTLDAKAEDQTLLMQVIDTYHQTLKTNTDALAYLAQRGLNHPEVIDYFKLGVANRTLAYQLPEKNRKAGAKIRDRLQHIGILRSSGHEHLNGSLIIPVINKNQVLDVYGRKLKNNLRKGTAYHLYCPGPHQGVFNLDALEHQQEIILCESLIDALTFWCAGYRNVTASYGIEGFTAHHLAAFKQFKTKRILIAYDRDAAGDKAALSLADKLIKQGIDCYRIQFPKGMDANEYSLQVTPASQSLGVVIRSAIWLGSGEAPKREQKPVLEITESNEITKAEEPQLTEKPTTVDELPSIPANVIPPAPTSEIEAQVNEQEIIIHFASRRYRIRGLDKNLSVNQLKVNILASKEGLFDVQGSTSVAEGRTPGAIHIDTFDLYAAKSRALFIKQVALELNETESIIKTDIGNILLKCESLQEQQIKQTLKTQDTEPTMDEEQKTAAIDYLKSPYLINNILNDFNRCGVVGESSNTLIGYLACISRKLDKPLAIIIQSTSAAGKSALMDAILNFMPTADRVQYSAMTGQSLFYMGETNLKHKILAIAEEEGAQNASYALKLLQSEGELTIASTGKDDNSGELVTKEYKVEGPVMLFLTTTAIDIDEELMNRCLVLTVNESRAQTKAIHALQRQQHTLEGLLQNQDKNQLTQLHRNAQQLIHPLLVANPYAEQLTFIDDKTRTRRDHLKYLTLINSIALLHQYQRDIKTIKHNGQELEYIEVTEQDIIIANDLAHEVLGRSLNELPPQTYTLLEHIKQLVQEQIKQQAMNQNDYRFSRKDIRDATGWSDGQLKIHCSRLTELEYLLIHQGGRGKSIVYELLYDGDLNNNKHLMGLIDPTLLNNDEQTSGQTAQKTAPSQAQVSPKIGSSQTLQNSKKANKHKVIKQKQNKTPKNAYQEPKANNTSHHSLNA